MQVQSVDDLLYSGLMFTLDAEQQLTKGTAKVISATSDPEVKQMFEKSETQGAKYAQRIREAISKLGREQGTAHNGIAEALVAKLEDLISTTKEGVIRDAALIVAFNQIQAYRVSCYGSLKTFAGLLGKGDTVSDLQMSLDESKAGDDKLTNVAEQRIDKQAMYLPSNS